MSIIHDALKKAEQERATKREQTGGAESQKPPAEYNPFGGSKPPAGPNPFKIDDAPPPRTKTSATQMILLVVLVGALGGFVYWRFFHKTSPGGAGKPKIAAAPETSSPKTVLPQKTAPLPDDATDAEKLRHDALTAYSLGDFEKSREGWDRLTLLAPTDSEVYNNLGLTLKKLSKTKEAKEAYEKALGLKPDYPQGLNNLGVLLMEGGDRVRARGLFERAVKLNPSYGEAFFHLAAVLENEGNGTLAVKNYEEFLRLKPDLDPTLKAQVEIRIAVLKAKGGQ
ncbi:MAG: tetratricopeptide repeat protein [Deltaproteobacteria bacterium]|nr:tetratricopeptide repeat protein [Deltaproteobacteria bacterium]